MKNLFKEINKNKLSSTIEKNLWKKQIKMEDQKTRYFI